MKKLIPVLFFSLVLCAVETLSHAQSFSWGAAIRAWRRANTVRFIVTNADATPSQPLPYIKLWFKRKVLDGEGGQYWRTYASCETNESGQCSAVLPRHYSTGTSRESRYFRIAVPVDPGDVHEPANDPDSPNNVAYYIIAGHAGGYLNLERDDWRGPWTFNISSNEYSSLSNEE